MPHAADMAHDALLNLVAACACFSVAESNAQLFKENSQLKKTNSETVRENERLKSEKHSHGMREKRLAEEKRMLEENVEFTNDELKKAIESRRQQNQGNSEAICELQQKYDSKTEEARSSAATCKTLQKKCQDLQTRTDDSSESLRLKEDELRNEEEHFRKELAAKTRLSDLLKEQADGSKKKADELLSAVTEFKKELKTQQDEHLKEKSGLEQKFEAVQEQQKTAGSQIEKLEEELQRANDLLPSATKKDLESIAQQFPVAHATSQMLKGADKFMTLTEAYSKLVAADNELLQVNPSNCCAILQIVC